MKRPRIRVTARWLMVAVAILAIGLGSAVQAIRIGSERHRRASFHGTEAGRLGVSTFHALMEAESGYPWFSDGAGARAAALSRRAEYHQQLRDRYTRAAWRPWLGVEPDPPEAN